MPDRIIRESALASESLGMVSDFAERLFFRLTVVADDYGRFNANVSVIRGRCMPLVAGATARRIKTALAELQDVKAIQLYSVDDKLYGCFDGWKRHQRTREGRPKFPPPPDYVDPPQVAASCGESPQVAALFENGNVNENENGNVNDQDLSPSSADAASGNEWTDSLWLLSFLKEQQTAFNGTHLPQLIQHDFWADLSEAVNGIDLPFVKPEFAKMAIWLRDNPRKRPTAKGVRKFVSGWLERAAERRRRERNGYGEKNSKPR
jgi:hypothetical protein